MKTFHGDQKIKDKYLDRVKAHQKADRIQKGIYWQNGKGCAVGCTIEGNDHDRYETELGIPKEVAYLEDVIFEELPNKEAMKFPLRFLQAVPVGADLSLVTAQFVVWQFEDKKYGLKNIKEVKDDKEVYGFCEEVVALYKRVIAGDKPTEKEFEELYLKIDRARARARAWAWAWARAGAGAGAGAEYDRLVIAMADKLIELVKNSK